MQKYWKADAFHGTQCQLLHSKEGLKKNKRKTVRALFSADSSLTGTLPQRQPRLLLAVTYFPAAARSPSAPHALICQLTAPAPAGSQRAASFIDTQAEVMTPRRLVGHCGSSRMEHADCFELNHSLSSLGVSRRYDLQSPRIN